MEKRDTFLILFPPCDKRVRSCLEIGQYGGVVREMGMNSEAGHRNNTPPRSTPRHHHPGEHNRELWEYPVRAALLFRLLCAMAMAMAKTSGNVHPRQRYERRCSVARGERKWRTEKSIYIGRLSRSRFVSASRPSSFSTHSARPCSSLVGVFGVSCSLLGRERVSKLSGLTPHPLKYIYFIFAGGFICCRHSSVGPRP